MSNEVATEIVLNPSNPREREMMLMEREFSLTQRKAVALSKADVLPKQYQNNIPNCMIAMEMASRLKTGEMEIMQNLYIVHGNPAFSSKYLIALVNKSGVLRGRLQFKFVGEKGNNDYGCYAYGVDRETGNELIGTTIDLAMAQAEGWSTKTGSKWKTMPEQMLQYRAASFWSRVYAPDATMGMHTEDEVQEFTEKDITPQSGTAQVSSVTEMVMKKNKEQPAVIDQEPDVVVAEPEQEVEQEPERSKEFVGIEKLIDMANTEADLEAVLNLPLWDGLSKGEAPVLNHRLQTVRDSFSAATAAGTFGG